MCVNRDKSKNVVLTYLDVYHTFSDGGYSCNDPFPRLELFSEMSGSLKEVVWERNYNKTKMQVRRMRRGGGGGEFSDNQRSAKRKTTRPLKSTHH